MERSTQNKSIQTDQVIVFPIFPNFAKSDYLVFLEDQLDLLNIPVRNEYPDTPIDCYENISSQSTTIENDSNPYNAFLGPPDEGSYETIPETSSKSLTRFNPIYILKELLYSHDNCEVGDEFELINDKSNYNGLLCLKHLRTSKIMNIAHSSVELDENTPLRLGDQSRGIIECFLLKSDARYTFLIHRSSEDENMYILSVNQHYITKEAFVTHYDIRINKENNSFYFVREKELRHCFFRTFQQLVNDSKVHRFIPLSKPIDRHLIMNEDELWQIDYNQLIIKKNIGIGEFGEVFRGKWKRPGPYKPIDIAIKRLKLNNVASDDFAKEICTMKHLRNKYLVLLLGISIDPKTNEKLMITEFMIDGDLKSWLEKQSEIPLENILVRYSHQICLGMSYLERYNYVHRDLACRNVLLRGDQAKIADFGMAVIGEVDLYYSVSESKQFIGKLPYRWTAPEIFAGKISTSRSDVWSFGICLIEIWSKGGLPYPFIKHLSDVRLTILNGYVHEKPQQCPEIYYDIIKTCLISDPNKRPSFKELTEHFKNLLIGNNEQNRNMNVTTNKDIISDYSKKEKSISITDKSSSASSSSKTEQTTKKKSSYYSTEHEYLYADATSTKEKFPSSVFYDVSSNETSPLLKQTISHIYMPSNATDTLDPPAIIKSTSNYSTTRHDINENVDLSKNTDKQDDGYAF